MKPSIRKIVDDVNVPLPVQWSNFIHSWENKSDLTNFLSEEMMKEAMNHNYNFVTSGGYKNIEDFGSVNNLNTSILHSTHEEADMRIIVHYYLQWARDIKIVVVKCADTDVLVLLHHFKAQLTTVLGKNQLGKYLQNT